MKLLGFILALNLINLYTSDGKPTKGCDHPADVVFILDSSSSIYELDFYKQLTFVKDLVKGFNIGLGPTQTRVGVVTFGESYWLKFSLNKYVTRDTLQNAIGNIRFRPGYKTKTDSAIKFVADRMFTSRYGSRPDVDHIAIVITDGKSTETEKTKAAASAARDSGIQIYAIGVGPKISMDELKDIASDPDDHFVYTVDSYNALQSITDDLAVRTCEVTTTVAPTTSTTTLPPTTTSTTEPTTTTSTTTTTTTEAPTTEQLQQDSEECSGKPTDMYFVLDSSGSIGWKNYKIQKEFVKDLVSDIGVDHDETRIGVLIFSERYKLSIPLGSTSNKAQLLSAIDRLPYLRRGTNTGAALGFVRDKGFANGLGRPYADKVLILLTDGLSRDPVDTKLQATRAREAGISLFAIGIGKGADMQELHDIASQPARKYVMVVDEFASLKSKEIKDSIAKRTCIRKPNDQQTQPTCSSSGLVDMMFVYDSFTLGAWKSLEISKFAASVTNTLDLVTGNIHIGRLIDNCLDVGDIRLGFSTSTNLYNINFPTTQDLLIRLTTNAFLPTNGARTGARSLSVVFLDSEDDDIENNLLQISKISNTEISVILIGNQKNIAPVNVGRHILYSVDSYQQLRQFRPTFSRSFCTQIAN